jgi:ribosome-binding ATPase YchF (GTP1/OBG family)
MDALIIVVGPMLPGGASQQPVLDYRSVVTNLLVSDLAMIERRIDRLCKELLKGRHPEIARDVALMERCRGHLEQDKPLRSLALTQGECKAVKGFHLLSIKPALVVLNHAEGMDPAPVAEALAAAADARVIPLCGSIEMDIARMPIEDTEAFLQDLGIGEPALTKMIRVSYELLGRISFFTVGEDECRAWTIPSGLKAPEAAGYIHTDLQHGFIRAEVIAWDRLLEAGSYGAARAKGIVRLEGKDYVVRDGDVMDVKFRA